MTDGEAEEPVQIKMMRAQADLMGNPARPFIIMAPLDVTDAEMRSGVAWLVTQVIDSIHERDASPAAKLRAAGLELPKTIS